MSSRILKITLSIMAASIICKATGLIREISLASYLGISKYTDAYLIATAIPLEIFNVIFASVGVIFMPLYIEVVEQEGKEKALAYMNNLINSILLFSTVLCILGMIFTKPLIKLMAIGFNSELISITTVYTRIMFPAIITLGISGMISVYLQANNNFILPALLTVPTNIIITMSILSCIHFDSTILAYGTLIGLVSQLLVQIPAAYRNGYRYKFIISFKDIRLASTIKMIIPALIGSSVKELNVFIARIIATTLFVGGVATLNFAHKIDLLIFGFFTLSFSTVIYRKLSQFAAQDKMQYFSEVINKSISMLTIILIPITIFVMQKSEHIVTIIYMRGSFDENAVAITSIALYFYAIGILGSGIRDILTKAFYSLKNTKTPLINGIAAVVINIILSLILVRSMGIGGVALATSISSIFTTMLLLISITKRLPDVRLNIVIINFIKVLAASSVAIILMNGVTLFTAYNFEQNIIGQLLEMSFSVIGFAIIYSLLLKLMKFKELDLLVESIKTVFSKTSDLKL
jgi:putative peptidoglycan lipid II flippase